MLYVDCVVTVQRRQSVIDKDTYSRSTTDANNTIFLNDDLMTISMHLALRKQRPQCFNCSKETTWKTH